MEDKDLKYFGPVDYSIFSILLLLSIFIGLYFAFFYKQRQNSVFEYLLASRRIGILPIAMSLTASFLSGLFILGYAAEIYVYGTQIWISAFDRFLLAFFGIYNTLPIYYDLGITSCYQYLKLRYNNSVRTLVAVLSLLRSLIGVPIAIYMPALALSQATGFDINILIPTVCAVCIFYTSIGGLRTVAWTDTLQMVLIVLGMFTVAIKGTYDVGGFQKVWDLGQKSGRIEIFNMDIDPTLRHTFWTVAIGRFVTTLGHVSKSQVSMQRYLSLRTTAQAKWAVLLFSCMSFVLFTTSCYTGLVVYAAFYDCDPISTKLVRKGDGILPYFVMKVMTDVPGLLGVFVSGVFSAALSTLSTSLNTLTGVIYTDLIKQFYKKPVSERTASFIMKIIVVIIGFIYVGVAFFIDKLDSLVQVSATLSGFTSGSITGIFILGFFWPWANSSGVLIGGFISSVFVTWITIGSQMALKNKQIKYPRKPVSIEGCSNDTLHHYYNYLNQTNAANNASNGEKPFVLFTVSYLYLTVIGFVLSVVIGIIASFLTGPNKPKDMDPRLFSPIIRKFLGNKRDAVVEDKLIGNLERKINTNEER